MAGFGSPRGRSGVSSGTKSLVSDMMKQSGLTAFQQRQLMQKMSSGAALPKTCNPTSSESRKAVGSTPASKNSPKVMNPKNTTGGKRQIKHIQQAGRDQFKPAPKTDREELKLFHQESLVHGKKGAEARQALREKARMKQLQPKPARKPQDAGQNNNIDEFMEAATEVAELQTYLQQMELLGAIDQTKRAEVRSKLSQRVCDMKRIDKERTRKLEQLEKAAKQ
eukprot:m.267308 g.267308  ORF g.267308 m.267308 type:complete len:223 (+) comp72331_c0_seq1:134-802(+)